MQRYVDSDIQGLKQMILSMAGAVERQLDLVCEILSDKNPQRLSEIPSLEERINSLQMNVDQACVQLLARQAPLARDLRLVVAVLKINTDLERMGDQVVNIGHCARDLAAMGQMSVIPAELSTMGGRVREMVRESIDSFVQQDVLRAKQVLLKDDMVDLMRDEIVEECISLMRKNPNELVSLLEVIMIARNFERLGDHATNLAEEVIYFATGDDVRHGHNEESKRP